MIRPLFQLTAAVIALFRCSVEHFLLLVQHISIVPLLHWNCTSASLSVARTIMCSHVQLNCPFVPVSSRNRAQQEGKSVVAGFLQRTEEMGQRQVRYIEAAPVNLPSARTLCAHRLEHPGHRFCCQYQHYQAYPERVLNYSPPFSPSLFKRPSERR